MSMRNLLIALVATGTLGAATIQAAYAQQRETIIVPKPNAEALKRIMRVDRSRLARLAPMGPLIKAPFTIDQTQNHQVVYEMVVTEPGRLHARADWKGRGSLALILDGPGQNGYYARADGQSPLDITFNIGTGSGWRLSLVNFGNPFSASGQMSLRITTAGNKPTLPSPTAESDGELTVTSRTIEPDGSVLITYEDKSKLRLYDGGREHIALDGTVTKSLYYQQVQVAHLPDFPGGGDTLAWLQNHSEALLNVMSIIVGQDQAAIDYYLEGEEDDLALYHKIIKRTETISRLSSGS